MCLNELNIGDTAIITNMRKDLNKPYIEELNSLGLTTGSKIKCVRKSILGNLMHIELHNTCIVVRTSEACIIEVQKL